LQLVIRIYAFVIWLLVEGPCIYKKSWRDHIAAEKEKMILKKIHGKGTKNCLYYCNLFFHGRPLDRKFLDETPKLEELSSK
jgi:hypothetical protein